MSRKRNSDEQKQVRNRYESEFEGENSKGKEFKVIWENSDKNREEKKRYKSIKQTAKSD